MARRIVGVAVPNPSAAEALESIRRLEETGIPAAWMTSGGGGGDALTLFGAAAAVTRRLLLGTSIVPLWGRHPVVIAQQAQAIASLAPGRFRLGIGPSHQQGMERTFGVRFRRPLGHLREYVSIVKALLRGEEVEMEGEFYTARGRLPAPVEVPVLISALRARSFRLAGEIADGAISWVCPHDYLRDVALPALQEGARAAGREPPPLIVHAALCLDDDTEAVREAVRRHLGYFPQVPFYAAMFAEAGFPDSPNTGWTDAMIDAITVYGDEDRARRRLEGLFEWGASEVLATVITTGDDPEASAARSLRFLADFCREGAGS